ncbi:hypothetical protein KFL_000130010 [Klebsormidium nitens]|uniref:Ubiquitin-like domain-containing protein n=1 Tax=Klebsormidium nitens TaxID=105231 RepID=A0A1Y1HRF3_KLENI|nr:hypothetical protein KFL_000130010 [Klebsormidium nitens]|eukprot:GAQ78418.1 hypothetical protein KFL_000130010 [Klebsormidium nitens]
MFLHVSTGQPAVLRNIFVKLHTGTTVCFSASSNQTVRELKQIVEEKGGLPCTAPQVLRMGPILLRDDWLLREHGLVDGICLEESVPLSGGAPEADRNSDSDGEPLATWVNKKTRNEKSTRTARTEAQGQGSELPVRPELGRGMYETRTRTFPQDSHNPAINSAGAKIFDPEYADQPKYFTDINGAPVQLEDLEAFLCGESSECHGDLEDCDDDDRVFGGRLTAERRNAINQKRQNSRPKNTRRSYYPKLKHFVKWCREHGRCMPIPFADRAAAFLSWRTRNTIGQAEKIESNATFDMNLAALTDAKRRLEDNFNWDLGTRLCDYGMIKNIGENVRTDAERERVESREDPQLNTGADALTREEFEKCCGFLAEKARDEAALRYGSMMKVARQAIFRGDDQRGVRIADMFFHDIPLKAVGPDPCACLCIISRTGKTNVDPDWIDRLTWPSSHPSKTQQLSPDAHSAYVKEVFKKNEVICSKVLHAFRPSAALEAAVHGSEFLDFAAKLRNAAPLHKQKMEAQHSSHTGVIVGQLGNSMELALARLRGSHTSLMNGLRRLFKCFQNSESPPSAEEVASIAQQQLHEDLNFSPFKTPELNRQQREQDSRPRNLFPDPCSEELRRRELTGAVSRLAEAQQAALNLYHLAERQSASTDPLESAKAAVTLQRAKLQAGLADTLAKKVALLENSTPLPTSTSTFIPSSATSPANQPSSQPAPHDNSSGLHSAAAGIHSSHASSPIQTPTVFTGEVPESAPRGPESAPAARADERRSDPDPVRPARKPQAAPASRRGGLDEWDTYLLPSNVSVSEIWRIFREAGPNGKPSILQLMVRCGNQNLWYHQANTKEGQNNRKHQWHEKYKPILWDILADITDPKKRLTATASIKRLEGIEQKRELSTAALGKYLNGIYKDAAGTIKESGNKKALEKAVAVQARKSRAVAWIDDQISSGR